MRRIFLLAALSTLGLVSLSAERLSAQQSHFGSPFHRGGSSFFENIGVGFGFRIPGANLGPVMPNHVRPSATVGYGPAGVGGDIGFNQGGQALPPFGGFNPNAGGHMGFAVGGDGGMGFFNISAGQGSARSMVSQSPSVTVMNGGTGIFSDTIQRPFVIGVVPVVAGIPTVPQPFLAPGRNSMLSQRLAQMRESGEILGMTHSGEEVIATPVFSPSDLNDRRDPFSAKLSAARDSSAGKASTSVADIKRRRAVEDERFEVERRSELEEHLKNAERAERERKPGAARVYYQMAAQLADEPLRSELNAKIRELRRASR